MDERQDRRRSGPAPDAARGSVAADLREIATDLWRFRHLLRQLVRRDVRIRYKQAAMGFAWAIFTPALVAFSGWIMRLAIAHMTHTQVDATEIAGIAVKALPWAFFVGALGFGAASITSNLALVTKVYFPREVLPLAAVLAQLPDALVGLAVLLPALVLAGIQPTLALLWVPLLVLLLVALTAGVALFVSCANVFFRDVKYIVQVLLTFGVFVTPVFFEPAMLGPEGATLVMLNPLSGVLEGLRLAALGHDLLQPIVVAGGAVAWHPWYLAYSALWAVGGLLPAALLFHRAEFAFAEYV